MSRLTHLFRKLRSYFPERLPVGVTEFDAWAKSISEIYDLPTKDAISTKFTLASIIMHLGSQGAFKSKYFFYITMVAAAAKQVAGQVFYDIKEEQKRLAKEAAEKELTNESVRQS